ncbi:MAG: hypothetical protein GY774_01725 [Planctomycetes bacterium]|nr:hypothetical protein [Planctomycetota bacterium]
MNIIKWTEVLKLPPKYILPVMIFTGFFLIVPKTWLNTLGITTLISNYCQYITIAFLASCALLISHIFFWITNIIKDKIINAKYLRAIQITGKDYLQRLTPDEKNILKFYIINQKRTQVLDPTDGTVNGLVRINIIYLSARSSTSLGFPYNLQPWAWDFLNNNKGLLGISSM